MPYKTTVKAEDGINFYKPGAAQNEIQRLFSNAVEKGEVYAVELEIITAKGNKRWIKTIGIPLFEDG